MILAPLSVPGWKHLRITSASLSRKLKLFRISGIPGLARSCGLAKLARAQATWHAAARLGHYQIEQLAGFDFRRPER